jgi:NAD(P)-dependent dehydrogenase (short-subunit alcohol dehydrogenase family)
MKNVYILGGNGLIGSHLVNYFSIKNKVILIDKEINKTNFLKNKHNIKEVKIDITNLNKLNKKLDFVFKKFGNPEILINCTYPRSKKWAENSILKFTLQELRKNIDIHLCSYIWISKIFYQNMIKNKIKGNIILFSSMYGIIAQDESNYIGTEMSENAIYPIIKSGILGFVRQSAAILGKYQIRVNAISPGAIKGHVAGLAKKQNSIFVNRFKNRVPLKRLANPDELVEAVKYLSSEKSSYVTGSNLIVDGGWSII